VGWEEAQAVFSEVAAVRVVGIFRQPLDYQLELSRNFNAAASFA